MTPPGEPSPTARHETVFSTPSERQLVITRTFDAPRALVWMAFTDPRHLPHWQPERATMPVCEIDLRTGGAWRYVYRMTNGREFEAKGIYRDVDPPTRFVQVMNADGDESTMTTTFTEDGGRTLVRVENVYASTAARDRALQYAKFGTASGYARLDEHLPQLSS